MSNLMKAPLETGKAAVITRTVGWMSLAAIPVFIYMSFFFAPEDEFQGAAQRIFYIHVPSAWVAALAFFVVFLGSIMYLVKKDMKWDAYAGASAEVGLMFTTVVLVTGMLWGKSIWGVYWTWEPRLTSVLVLWLLYLAYVAVRAYVPDPTRKARFSAVLGIVAFIDVPIVYLSVKIWRTLHPDTVIVAEGGPQLPAEMLTALFVGIAMVTLIYVYFVRVRVAINNKENTLKQGARV